MRNGSWESQRFDDSHACSARAGRAPFLASSPSPMRTQLGQTKSLEVHLMHVNFEADLADKRFLFFNGFLFRSPSLSPSLSLLLSLDEVKYIFF